MTEQELREKIAYIVCGNDRCFGECVFYNGKGTPCQSKKPDFVLALVKEAGWKSPEEWQTEYLTLERKAHSTGRREVIEEIQKRSHVISEDDIDYGDFLSAGDRIIYAHVWQALQHLA